MFDELDSVILTRSVPREHIRKGMRGVVVAVYGDHEAYEVEFLDGPRTIALTTVRPDHLGLIAKYRPTDNYAYAD